jgi:hypothetical protein
MADLVTNRSCGHGELRRFRLARLRLVVARRLCLGPQASPPTRESTVAYFCLTFWVQAVCSEPALRPGCCWSGDLSQVVAVVEDDAQSCAEGLCVAAEGGDLVGVEVTVFDLTDPARGNAHQVGDLALGQAEPLPLLGQVVRAGPGFGAGAFGVERGLVAVVELCSDVVPVVEVGHVCSLRFLSYANHRSAAIR